MQNLHTIITGDITMLVPLERTLVVIRTFSFPSLNRSSTAILCSTVRSPDNKATACPSLVIFSTSHWAVLRVWEGNENLQVQQQG